VKILQTIKRTFNKLFIWDISDLDNDAMKKNEVIANRNLAVACFSCSFIILVSILLNYLNVFHIAANSIIYMIIAFFEFFIPAVICFALKGRNKSIKFILLTALSLGVTIIYVILSATVVLFMLVPLVLSCRYYNKKLVVFSYVITCIMLIIGSIGNVLYGCLDMNALFFNRAVELLVDQPNGINLSMSVFNSGATKKELILMMLAQSALPNLILTSIIALICFMSAGRGLKLASEQMAIVAKTSRISSELEIATNIQANMLPNIFPAFPEHEEFDIFAKMCPAKEVGGDFYDLFMVDDTHVALVIADVSGKGVPAALFMVTAKTLIKDYTQMKLEPEEVFTRVNKILCERNDAALFVTAWMCVVDLATGHMKYVNAGHNPPLIYSKDKGLYYLKTRPGFVLAGIDTFRYHQAEFTLKENDRLLLYTDGVTEATNSSQQLYGENRLFDYVNNHLNDSAKSIVEGIWQDTIQFKGEMEQFDDITMLAFYLKEVLQKNEEKELEASDDNLPNAVSFLEDTLNNHNVPQKIIMQMSVALEELFTNVAHYAYIGRIGKVKIALNVNGDLITLILKDAGIPFNPLEKDDPNIKLSAEERDIGGLGIFMVKKTMDNVSYVYKEGMNNIIIEKRF